MKAASGSERDGVWTWDAVDPKYAWNGQPSVSLAAGQSVSLKLEVTVPETAPYDNTRPISYDVSATGVHSGHTQMAENTLLVTGIPLDGWSGPLSYEKKEQWSLPMYAPVFGYGDILELKAVSAVHMTRVTAALSQGEEQPKETELALANPETYVKDGYKLWTYDTVVRAGEWRQ
ncbi:hypothetical protein U6Q21_12575, partial [Cutibacterium acnes]